jgi:hypothetical protein
MVKCLIKIGALSLQIVLKMFELHESLSVVIYAVRERWGVLNDDGTITLFKQHGNRFQAYRGVKELTSKRFVATFGDYVCTNDAIYMFTAGHTINSDVMVSGASLTKT